jgi:hypothetical protein
MKTTKEIIEESRSLRAGISSGGPTPVGNFVPPKQLPWVYTVRQVLAPVGFSWCPMIWDVYLGEYDIRDWSGDPDITIILHGHSREKFCSASSLCHILGYKGSADFTAVQRKQWEKFGYGD